MTFGDFFDSAAKVHTRPPKQGVQGIVLRDPVLNSEKKGYPHGTRPGDGGLAEMKMLNRHATYTLRPIETEDEEYDPFADSEMDLSDYDSEVPNDDNYSHSHDDVEVIDDLDDSEEDPNFQGVIRTVQNAHLVYKRSNEDGAYDELWIYYIEKGVDDGATRKAILAGTDIEPGEVSSADGTQSMELWTVGNAQMLYIKGLPQ